MLSSSTEPVHHILLADDDNDDCLLFKDSLDELPLSIKLTTVRNGEDLMLLLNQKNSRLPDVLFLDLNMPRKNGFECLLEIKNTERLKELPVIIFSTSYASETVQLLYKNGAQYYIRKPNEFTQLRKVICQAITLSTLPGSLQPPREEFVLSQEFHQNEFG